MDNGRLPGMESYRLAPTITTVTTNPACEACAVTTALQFNLHDRHPYQVYMILFLLGGDRFSYSQSI